MRVRSGSTARTAIATALLAASAALVGCGPSAPTAPTETDGTPTPTATSAAPSPTASATPAPTPAPSSTPTEPAPSATAGQMFETQNGTMRLPLPDGWTVDDQSRLGTDLSGRPQWENSVGFRSPSGTELQYYDGFGALAGFHRTEFGVVEQRPTGIGQGIGATSWWVREGRYFLYAGLTQPSSIGAEPVTELSMPGVDRNHRFTMLLLGESAPAVESEAEAEEVLGGPDVLEALEVMAGLELTGVDGSAMPPGVEP